MTQKHHIIPKYRGGTDAKENLVEVTVTQHAMFHYCNWRLWGAKEDWLAWQAITGLIGNEQAHRERSSLGGLKGIATIAVLRETDPEFAAQEKERIRKVQPKAVAAALSPQSRQKRIDSLKRIKHQSGESNSQYGTMWITNGEINKKIRKTEPIPEGYYKGRKLK